MRRFVILCLTMALVACSGSSDKSKADSDVKVKYVTKAEYGEKWPFTFDDGLISCIKGGVFIADGKTLVKYPLTGLSMTYMRNGMVLARPLEEVWLPNPKNPGAKINVNPFIDEGLKLCEKK